MTPGRKTLRWRPRSGAGALRRRGGAHPFSGGRSRAGGVPSWDPLRRARRSLAAIRAAWRGWTRGEPPIFSRTRPERSPERIRKVIQWLQSAVLRDTAPTPTPPLGPSTGEWEGLYFGSSKVTCVTRGHGGQKPGVQEFPRSGRTHSNTQTLPRPISSAVHSPLDGDA